MAIQPLPPSTTTPTRIEILTLNCWGLKYISTHRRARLAEIGRALATRQPRLQIVGLQECWTQEDYEAIRALTRDVLPHGKFYHGGVFGAGLVILSAWPLVQTGMYAYPLNGRPTAFWRGDWYVGKGVACARIRAPGGVVLEVFCTHLHAPYEREPNDSYMCHRTAQAWEIAKLMRGAAERGHVVIGLGDFNMLPSSLAHRLISVHAPVVDVWLARHPPSSSSSSSSADTPEKRGPSNNAHDVSPPPPPSLAYNLTHNGTTCDSALNTWRWSKSQQRALRAGREIPMPPADDVLDPAAKRLDYIFVGDKCQVEHVQVGMTQRQSTLGCSLSDHFSVEATLLLPLPPHPRAAQEEKEETFLPLPTYDAILSLTHHYRTRQLSQRRLRLAHFAVQSLVTLVGCLTAVWWAAPVRPALAFVLMLVATLGFAAGLLDGLIGGLFVSAELRALKEFEWEMRNLRERAATAAAAAGRRAC